jgi:F-type H+-transporting ATPase subunit alpha
LDCQFPRVGGNAQIKAMKSVAGTLRLDLAQFRELEAFAKFGSDLDKATQAQLTRGERMVEILKQNQYVPMDVAKQIVIIFAGTKGHLDDVPANQVNEFETGLFDYLDANNAKELNAITAEGKISEEVEKNLNEAIASFKGGFIT